MNKIINWLGQTMEFEGNFSLAIAKHEVTNFPGEFVYEDELFNIAADPEIPIKGYMILATVKETRTITELNEEERNRLIDLTNRLLEAMHKSGFEKVMIYQDEACSGNLHISFIPKHEWTYKFNTNLRKMGDYAKNKLNISDEYRKELLETIKEIKKNFK